MRKLKPVMGFNWFLDRLIFSEPRTLTLQKRIVCMHRIVMAVLIFWRWPVSEIWMPQLSTAYDKVHCQYWMQFTSMAKAMRPFAKTFYVQKSYFEKRAHSEIISDCKHPKAVNIHSKIRDPNPIPDFSRISRAMTSGSRKTFWEVRIEVHFIRRHSSYLLMFHDLLA